jgi:hypothetical protein
MNWSCSSCSALADHRVHKLIVSRRQCQCSRGHSQLTAILSDRRILSSQGQDQADHLVQVLACRHPHQVGALLPVDGDSQRYRAALCTACRHASGIT